MNHLSKRLGIIMYDLRILMIWIILGFLLYLISIRPDRAVSAKKQESKVTKEEESDNYVFDHGRDNRSIDQVVIDRLRETCFIDKFDFKNFDPSIRPTGVIPEDMVINLGIIPIKIEDDILILAMIDPFDLNTLDIVRELTGHKIQPVKIAKRDFKSMIR